MKESLKLLIETYLEDHPDKAAQLKNRNRRRRVSQEELKGEKNE